jgi:lipopolysaccharide export system protein LptC
MADAAISDHAGALKARWEPRRQLTLHAARRRSQLLSLVRIALVAAASASFSAFFGFMTLHAVMGGFSARDEVSVEESLRMVNPRFTGRMATGEPFVVTALSATRRSAGSDLVELERPVYESAGRRVAATAGVYNQKLETLDLSGEVILADAQGNTFSSAAARVDGDSSVVYGDRAIRGAGPLGAVRADSYEIHERGERLILRGRVQGVINQSGNGS